MQTDSTEQLTEAVSVANITDEFDRLVHMADENRLDYTILKTCEELTELQERLLKFHLKTPEKRPSKEDVAEEIGDVFIRIAQLTHALKIEELVESRIEYKVEKLWSYYLTGKYKGGV